MANSISGKQEQIDGSHEEGMRFAAIDVGSNALRLLFMQVIHHRGETCYRKVSLIRMPLRLGTEAFLHGRLSEQTCIHLEKSLRAFRLLLEAWCPLRWRACATSALRSVDNSNELLKSLHTNSGVELELISGEEEAALILENQLNGKLARKRACLFVDVGGGSTELTYFGKDVKICSASFPLGTVRLLNGQSHPDLWDDVSGWITANRPEQPLICVGSGGNINKLISMLGERKKAFLKLRELREQEVLLNSMSLRDRISQLGLRPDRADVMPHALGIYAFCMDHSGAEEMFVPRAGLADGLIRKMAQEFLAELD